MRTRYERHRAGTDQRSVPTGTCQYPGCENVARDGNAYCFDCRERTRQEGQL